MLIRFSAENYRSLRDRIELSLVATSLKHDGPLPVSVKGIPNGLLRVAAIYGPNASGKSNVLKAINYFSAAVTHSHSQWKADGPVPVQPFLLDEKKDEPSRFEAEFILKDTLYRYGFFLDSKAVREEWLYASPPADRVKRQLWYTRKFDHSPVYHFGRSLTGENRVIEKITRPNSLFLSAAAQNNHKLLLPLYEWLSTRINLIEGNRGLLHHQTAKMCANEKTKRSIIDLLAPADLGVTDIQVIDEEMPEPVKKMLQTFKEALLKEGRPDVDFPEKLPHVQFLHSNRQGTDTPLPIEDESAGTASFFGMLGPVVDTLEKGGVLCIDELDASLHPRLSLEIVRMFTEPKRNPRNAQLIFNSHDTNLLDERVLRRDEVWFTEKDRSGGTHLYPLSNFAPRKSENLERGYLQGRFGAVPFLTFADRVGIKADANEE